MMKNMDFRKLLTVAVCYLACAMTPAHCADDWRVEFDEVCSKTDIAMSLSKSEIQALTSSCDKLEKVINGLGETERKVFQKRLQMCKNLYLFVLEAKNNEPSAK